MIIDNYLGLNYDINSINGVNCWTLFRKVRLDELGKDTCCFTVVNSTLRGISETFSDALIKGDHGFKQVSDPQNYDLVLMTQNRKSTKHFHCGVWYEGKILHAKGSGLSGSVWYDDLIDFSDWTLEFWRDVE